MKHNATELKHPEKFAEFFIRFTENPECNVTQLARDVGLPTGTADALVKRLETRYLPLTNAVEKVTTKTIKRDIETALPKLLKRLADDDLIKAANLRDISVATNILIDKRQLLMGEPTQILTVEERRTLNEITPALVQEMARRNMPVLDVEYEDVVDAVHVSKTAKHTAKREDRGRV